MSPIDQQTRQAYEASRELEGKPFRSACYAPHASMYFSTNGDVIACCKNATYVLGNVADDRLLDIWNGKKADVLRDAVKDYRLGVGCEFCEWQIQGGQYDQVYARLFDELPVEDGERNVWPSMMEFAVSNTCNLACVMCYGVLSSTIRAHREKLPPLPKVYDDRFFDDLRLFLPHLKIAKFFGGEPFLAQENFRIWDMMIAEGIEIPCHVTTNGTQFNKKVERILEAFPVHLSISLDGATKETMESIRVNADFEKTRANVDRFRAYTREKGTEMGLTYCLMQQNWHEFGAYLEYAESLGLEVFVNTVIDPSHCSLYTLPPDEVVDIARRMQEMDAGAGYSKLDINGHVWSSLVEAVHKNASDRQREGISDIRQGWIDKSHLAHGWELVGEGKQEEGLAAARKIPESHGDFYQGLVLQAHVLRQTDRLEEAGEVLDRAVQLYAKGPNAYMERAWLRLQLEQPEAAYDDAIEADRLISSDQTHSLHPYVQNVLSLCCSHNGRHTEAVEAAARALELQPDNAWFHVHHGWCLVGGERFADAVAAAERALELDPENPEAPRLKEHATTGLSKPGS